MEAMRKNWTDDRLDDFKESVNRRFDEVGRRFDEVDRRLDKIDKRFERLEDGLVAIQRSIVYLAVGLTSGLLAGFAAMIVLIATQM